MQLAFKTILVPVDFDGAADLALEYARVLARRFDAGLRVLHVVTPTTPLGMEFSLPDVTRANEKAVADGQDRLAEVLARVSPGDVIGQVVVGQPAERIVQYAAEHDVDLIVMGTHGRRALAHLLLGSVAERVVRDAPCPVLTVRDAEARRWAVPEEVSVAVS